MPAAATGIWLSHLLFTREEVLHDLRLLNHGIDAAGLLDEFFERALLLGYHPLEELEDGVHPAQQVSVWRLWGIRNGAYRDMSESSVSFARSTPWPV